MLEHRNYSDRFILNRSNLHQPKSQDAQRPDTYDKFLYREMILSQPHQSVEDHFLKRLTHKNEQ